VDWGPGPVDWGRKTPVFFAQHGFSVVRKGLSMAWKGFAILRKGETKLWFG